MTGDASIIETAIPVPEPNDDDLVDEHDDNDDTYIDNGHVAPVNSLGQGQDDEFFCINVFLYVLRCFFS